MSESSPSRILVVDDTDANRYALTRMLQAAGYEPLEAATGNEGIARSREMPDLIILDVRLPDVDGFEVCRIIKSDAKTKTIPVLQMSASFVKSEDQARGLEGGGDGYLVQPVDKSVLLATVKSLLRIKKAEDEMRQAKEAAESANSAKDQFLAALSHELRTPLTPILNTVQMLEMDRARLPGNVLSALEIIRRNVQLEARLIDDLLDLTRIVKGKIELSMATVDLHHIIEAALNICLPEAAAKRQQIVIGMAAKQHHVHGDAARLQQVVWNLVKNAIKFTPAEGRVEVRTTDADGKVVLTVSDTGVGIPPESMPRIFTAFEQGGPAVTRQFGGLGLGLYISRKIVELHEGALLAHSEGNGKGATFTAHFATVAAEDVEDVVSEPASQEPGRPSGGASLRILLVEDHEDSNRSLTRILEILGHRVRPTRNTTEARQAAQGGRFDLLISDLGLPDGDGAQLMHELRRSYGLKGIALSGYGTAEDRQRTSTAGFSEHLVKPVNIQDLEAAIARTTELSGR